jgi:cytochrome P450
MRDPYDVLAPEAIRDPYTVYRRLRADDPVHWSEALEGWILTRYDDVVSALRDPRLSAARIGASKGASNAYQDLVRVLSMAIPFSDPPDHTRLRALANKAFTSRVVERMRDFVEETVSELLDKVSEQGRMDLIADFAFPLPVIVIAKIIGVGPGERDRLHAFSHALSEFIGGDYEKEGRHGRADRALRDVSACFRELIAKRRARPEDDLMSALIAAEERGDVLSEEELIMNCGILLFAGYETTANLIGNGLLALLQHPNEAAELRSDPGIIGAAVEELLRYDSPVSWLVRVALEDLVVRGRRIEKGQRVFVSIGSANRDQEQFVDPDRLNFHREDNRHIAFGYGIHFCLGAPLARLEGRLAFPALLSRLGPLRIDAERLEWRSTLFFRGLTSLPLAFEAKMRGP